MNMKKGFTLIEILIVVAIIAILASVVLVGLGPTQQAGRDARRVSDLHEVQSGLELYYNKCGFYPGLAACAAGNLASAKYGNDTVSTFYGGMATAVTAAGTNIGVTSMPLDPSDTATYQYLYTVSALTGGTAYTLAGTMENGNGSVFNSYVAPAVQAKGDTVSSCASPVYCVSL